MRTELPGCAEARSAQRTLRGYGRSPLTGYEFGTRRRVHGLGWLLALVALVVPAGRVEAQAEIRNVTQPIPVVNTGGHSAPVRSLVFTPDGGQLLSAGFDKIINVWNLRESPPELARTIRPRIWRGHAGSIYTIALAPRPGADGQRLLAVAGFGMQNTRGEIGLFLYPGANDAATGTVAGELPTGAPQGHANTVMGLAFDPRGASLASASLDATVRIWDLTTRTTVAVLGGPAHPVRHTQPVNALAYLPDGRRLVTAGADGLVLLWDVDRRTVLASARPDPRRQVANDPAADAINALAVSPDGRWVVIGRENGDLVRYDAANLGNPRLLPKGAAGQGAIEALAISHDSKSLAVSVVSVAVPRAARPRVECDIELRALPDGVLRERLARSSNLVYACAFSPDDRRLAYAGGDTQGISLVNLADRNQPAVELAGQGSSLWDVGFAADSLAIGFARRRPDLPDPPTQYEDFDLQRNRVIPFAPVELSRALTSWNGWTAQPVDPHTIDVRNEQNRGFRLTLDPVLDRRWWSYSFLPPGPGHPQPTFAIGCEAGVAIYRLDNGSRARLYAGHNGPVYALAPSPDARWLVTGSSDQTARLWRLEGCDTLAALGARFVADGPGRTKVAAVERWGFAEAMGLRVGDHIKECYVGTERLTNLAALDPVLPNNQIQLIVQREGEPQDLLMGTTKRDGPALTLFPALDREWIVWTPQGYYETSAIGDRRYLGWHRNRREAAQPTDYFSFDHFEKDLRRPDALLRFLQTADRDLLAAAVAPPPPPVPVPAPVPVPPPPPVVARAPDRIVAEDLLPRVSIVAPERPAFAPLVVPAGDLPIRVRAASEDAVAGRGLIGSIRVRVDGGGASEIAVAPPQAVVERVVPLALGPGRHRVSVTARNDRDQDRTETFDVIAEEPPRPAEPPPLPLPPQLVVLAIGSGSFRGNPAQSPPIPFADADARALAAFLAAPLGTPRYSRVDTQVLSGQDATTQRIDEAFRRLDERRNEGEFARGDAVFVLIESHFLRFEGADAILGAESQGRPPAPAVAASTIADCLGQLADYGVKVVLLIDLFHERRPDPGQTNRALIDWSRSLYKKDVITMIASIHGPSQRLTTRGHGAFAQGVLDVLNVRAQSRLNGSPEAPLTLAEFQDTVTRNVAALTNRQQHARCYVPETISSKVPFFDPPRRLVLAPQAANE